MIGHIVWFVASIALSYIMQRQVRKKTPTMQPSSLDQIDFPTAEVGRAIPVVFGTRWLKSPNVVWYGNLKTTPIMSKGGGKK